MKTFRGHIVAADSAERTITIKVESLGGASGAVMGQEVTIVPTKKDIGGIFRANVPPKEKRELGE